MAIEMMLVVGPAGIRRKLRRPPRHQQASIAEKGVSATEKIKIRQVRGYQGLRRIATVEPRAMVEIVRPCGRNVVIVTTEENDFAVAVRRRNQCSVDGDNVTR
jgi:hypothetical protein